MADPRWAEVDRYLEDILIGSDDVLEAALAAAAEAGLPAIQVSAMQGRFLQLLASVAGARRILEIGTLGGYSAIWLARALPADGRLTTLELVPKHAEVARANIERAGLGDRVEIVVGPALASLQRLAADGTPPFDLVFIDADKEPYADYLAASVRLSRPGTVIVADNVIRAGEVAEPASQDSRVSGVRRFHSAVAADPRLVATAIQTVGSKGYDGFSLLVVQS